jgi:phospholipid/cholesterol/gamma-HCH transport system substrate-binding protein
MTARTSKFLLGLFIVIGLLIGLVGIGWLSGFPKQFKRYPRYATFFAESVEGLQTDGNVNYLGVTIGKIVEIRIAPGNMLVEVVMEIYRPDVITDTTVAQLSLAGITGTHYINLYPGGPTAREKSPKITFPVQYPVIASQPSGVTDILASAQEIMNGLKQIDFAGISIQLEKTVKATETLLSSPQMQRIMENMAAVTADLDSTVENVNSILEEGEIQELLLQTRKTLSEADALLREMNGAIQNMQLAETSRSVRDLTEKLDVTANSTSIAINATLDNLQQASQTLNLLLDRLYVQPSELLYSKPPPPRQREKR